MKARHERRGAMPTSPNHIARAHCWPRSASMCHSGCFGALIMNDPPRILIVDDNEMNRDIVVTRLERHGYETFQAADGEEALAAVKQHCPDLVLLDVMMPQLDGIETCRRLKCDATFPFLPIILVTAKVDSKDIVAGLDAGADEYLTKPVDQAALVARVRSVLRVKALHDQVQAQAAELATWNRTLEHRVAEQVAEIERIGRLQRFLPPQVAQLVSSGDERVLESHRREVTVVFCDLRDFTAFAEAAEPEEVIAVLREYHRALGALIDKFEGTVERFAGDGLMVLFNDPLPCAAPWARAVQMAIEMRDEVAKLAARLCYHALNGQILVDAKVHAEAEALAELELVGELDLKGFRRPVKAFNVRRPRTASA